MNDVNVFTLPYMVQAAFWIGCMVFAVKLVINHIKD